MTPNGITRLTERSPQVLEPGFHVWVQTEDDDVEARPGRLGDVQAVAPHGFRATPIELDPEAISQDFYVPWARVSWMRIARPGQNPRRLTVAYLVEVAAWAREQGRGDEG